MTTHTTGLETYQLSDGTFVISLYDSERETVDRWIETISAVYALKGRKTKHQRILYHINVEIPSPYAINKVTNFLRTVVNEYTTSVAITGANDMLAALINRVFIQLVARRNYQLRVFKDEQAAHQWLQQRTEAMKRDFNTPPFTQLIWDVHESTG